MYISNRKSFVIIISALLATVFIITLFAGGGYYLYKKSKKQVNACCDQQRVLLTQSNACENNELVDALIIDYIKRHSSIIADGVNEFYNGAGYDNVNGYIAHGGGVNTFSLTNSKEAIVDSIENGFKYIEVDLLETKDGKLVGGHDWGDLKKADQYKFHSPTFFKRN